MLRPSSAPPTPSRPRPSTSRRPTLERIGTLRLVDVMVAPESEPMLEMPQQLVAGPSTIKLVNCRSDPSSPSSPIASPARSPAVVNGVPARCCCCATVLSVPAGRRSFRCAVCTVTTDSAPPPVPEVIPQLSTREIASLNDDALAERMTAVFDRTSHALSTRQVFKLHGELYARAIGRARTAEALLEAVRTFISRPTLPLTAPAAAILLACPLLLQSCETVALPFDDRVELLGRLLGIVANLENETHHQLVSIWRRSLSLDVVGERARACATVLSWLVAAPKLQWRLKAAARVLALYRTVHGEQLAPDQCYVLALEAGGPAPMCQDYESWQQGRSTAAFTFCSFPYLIPLAQKLAILRYEARKDAEALARKAIHSRAAGNTSDKPTVTLHIRRSHLLNDSLAGIAANLAHLRKELRIVFVGEEGVDAGGVRREWFSLVVQQLFSPAYDMWLIDEDSGLAWPNAVSHAGADEFNLVGVIAGLAAKHGTPIDVPFAPAIYRKLLNRDLGLEDLRKWRPALARGLHQMLDYDGDVESTFCRSFVYEVTGAGEQLYRAELVPGGADRPVTNENRKEFVKLYVDYCFSSARKQFSAFRSGFMLVLRGNALTLFSPTELELLVRGSDRPIDLLQLKLNTQYRGFTSIAPTVTHFWRWIERASEAQRRDLVRFVCGSARLPATGQLTMTIHKLGEDEQRLPISHTCFNALCLPAYQSLDRLDERLCFAIEESQGFELK